jgi:hypothetical protein
VVIISRITPDGTKSYWAVARDPSGKQHWQLIGSADTMKIDDARVAELVLGHVQRGVAAIYNRHNYETEKGEALEKLATNLNEIVGGRKAA